MADRPVAFDRRTAEMVIQQAKRMKQLPQSQVGPRPAFVTSYRPGSGELEIGYVTEAVDTGGGVWAYNAAGPTITVEEGIPRDRLILPGVAYTPLVEDDPVLLARVLIDDVLTSVIWAAQEVRGTAACPEE